MQLSCGQHLQAALTIESHCEADFGSSLCLMGIAMLMLVEDLLDLECKEHFVCSDR